MRQLLSIVALASSLSLTACAGNQIAWELGAPRAQREGQVGITFTDRGVPKAATREASSSGQSHVAPDRVALDDERVGSGDR